MKDITLAAVFPKIKVFWVDVFTYVVSKSQNNLS